MKLRNLFRGLAAASAAVVFTVAGGAAALADEVVIDGDVLDAFAHSGEAMAVGAVACGVAKTTPAYVAVRRQGNTNSGNVTNGNTPANTT